MTNSFNFQFDSFVPNYESVGGNREEERDGMIMENPCEDYATYLRGKLDNDETISNYLKHVKTFAKRMDWRMKRLTQDDINEYVQWFKRNRQHNGNTARFNAIKHFLEWQGRYDLALPKQRMLPTNKHALTQEQMIHLCETARGMSWLHQLIFTLELICLRRPKDIRNLKINDKYGDILRYADKTSSITGIKKEVLSKWATNAWDNYVYLERPQPKTNEDAQYLILSDCRKFYGQHLQSNVLINRITLDIQRQSGIPTPNNEHFVNYLFKRTGITQQAHVCPNIKIIKEQAGHQKIETTLIYDRTEEDDTRKHLDIFEQVINGKDSYNRIQTKPEEVIRQITDGQRQIPRISYNQMDEEDNRSFSFSISFDASSFLNNGGEPFFNPSFKDNPLFLKESFLAPLLTIPHSLSSHVKSTVESTMWGWPVGF